MSDPLRLLRINALELLRRPGTVHEIQAIIGSDLKVDNEALAGAVKVNLVLKAMRDGIEVIGTIVTPWDGFCRRCLVDVSGWSVAEVDECYQPEPTDKSAYPLDNNQLDLVPMTRQLVALELGDERLCQPDCAGLCPVCGADRNEVECMCDATLEDDRWSALDDFVLDD